MGEFWQAPKPVEAVHFTGDTDVLNRFVGADGWTRADAVDMPYMDDDHEVVVWSEMFQAHLPCRVDWWVVHIANGSFLPLSPEVFEATYDRNVCRCGHREQSHRLGPCRFMEIDPDDEPVKCRCAAFDRAPWAAGMAAGPQATPDQPTIVDRLLDVMPDHSCGNRLVPARSPDGVYALSCPPCGHMEPIAAEWIDAKLAEAMGDPADDPRGSAGG